MSNIELLRKYYKEVCTPLIFIGEQFLENNSIAKIYLYDFSKEEELENFKKVFQEYMTMYVRNEDIIEKYNFTENISEQLVEDFKKIYRILTPDRDAKISGIFGELFNDYYVKNVLNNEVLLTYAYKKVYSDNNEAKGIDVVCCQNKEGGMEFIFSEAKFVANMTKAKAGLIGDISGEYNHLNPEVINGYMYFVLNRQQGLDKVRLTEVTQKIDEINRKIIQEDKKFIEIINELGYSIRFIYFAIFEYGTNRTNESFRSAIEEIISEFNNQVESTGVINYSMEIVFIPTFNKAMDLKTKMEE